MTTKHKDSAIEPTAHNYVHMYTVEPPKANSPRSTHTLLIHAHAVVKVCIEYSWKTFKSY